MISGFVYFMKPVGMAGPIKIGCSRVPKDRLAALSAWSPFALELIVAVPGNERLEANIHDCFADRHVRSEWFNPDSLLLAGIEALIAGVPVERAFDLSAKRGNVRKQRNRKSGNGWTPIRRQMFGFSARLRWAAKRLRHKTGESRWEPKDVEDMLDRNRAQLLTAAEISRVKEVLADPEKHFLTDAQRWPKSTPTDSRGAAA